MTMPTGFRAEDLGRHTHYVTTDEKGRAVIGPVRHRITRSLMRQRAIEEKRRVLIDGEAVARDLVKLHPTYRDLVGVGRIDFTSLKALTATPHTPPTPSRRARALAALRSAEWHGVAQQAAKTTLLWSFTLFAVALFTKALVLVLPW